MSEEKKKEVKPKVKVKEHALETRVKDLEIKLHKSEVNNRLIKIHSKWADFKKDKVDTSFLDGVQYALDNYKAAEVKEHSATAKLNSVKKEVRQGTMVIDEDNVPDKIEV